MRVPVCRLLQSLDYESTCMEVITIFRLFIIKKKDMMLLKSAWMIYKQDKQQTLSILCIFLVVMTLTAGVTAWVREKFD